MANEIQPWQVIDTDRTPSIQPVYPSMAPIQIAPMQEILHVAVPLEPPVGASMDVVSAATITPAAPGSRTLDLGSFNAGATVSFTCFGGHPYLQVNNAGPDGRGTLEFTPDTNTYGRVGVTIDGVHMDYALDAIDEGTLGWIYELPPKGHDTDHLIAQVIPYDGTLIPGHLPVLPQPPL
ncbi:MAG: hypothetical protein ABW220_14660 [Burkholderiaceae bacterium]